MGRRSSGQLGGGVTECPGVSGPKIVHAVREHLSYPVRMPRQERWVIFGDDAGDPSPGGSSCFGYALLAMRSSEIPGFVEERTRFRANTGTFHESKGGAIGSTGFAAVLAAVSLGVQTSGWLAAATFIRKERYSGAWLTPTDKLPHDPTFLRNYVIRKALEFLFDEVNWSPQATADLVLDRVD